MKLAKPVLFALLIVFVSMVQAQYFNEQVLEKSFEKTDFFYHPYYLNPYGISGFGDVAPGLLDDPLLNLQLNPAYTVSDSVNRYYIYVDFRNSRNVADDEPYEPWRIYSSSMWMDCLPYSYYHTQKRTDLEPVFSGACLFRPFQLKNQWTVGITYQIVSKDEAFYHIPQDIYRSNIGYDYNGYAVAEGGYMPIIDRYQGSDEMHHEGHFLSILTGIRLMPRLDIGFQFSRVLFDRTGSLGSENIQNRMWYHDNDLYQRDLLERWQDYAHWDISGGVNYRYNHKSILGVGAGYLKGRVKQWLNQQSQYDYSYGMENEGREWSHYFQSGDTEQNWNHDGRTLYGIIHLKAPLTAQNTIHLAYRFLKEDVDIDLFSNVLDTSYSNYHYADDEWMSEGLSVSSVLDDRTGSGNREGIRHYFTAAYQMQIDKKTRLHFGCQYQHHAVRTKTTEHVLASRFSENMWKNTDYNDGYFHFIDEKKQLQWDLKINSYTFQIPVVITHRLSRSFVLLFGVNRRMTSWEITDETLAVFDYRDMTIDGEPTHQENFGERYRQPREKKSDVTTLLLGGLTIIPSPVFNIRLLAVPRWVSTYDGTALQGFQWWIHFNLTQ